MAPNPYENVNIYSKNQKAQAVPTGNSRDTDARALLSCAFALDEAKSLLEVDPRSRENLKIYGEALRRNQQLWTIFQVALMDPQSPLPLDLRGLLLNLSQYVDKTSFQAIGKYKRDLLDSLISINRMIAAGLSKQPAAGAQPPMPPMPDPREIPTSLITSA